jgi:uncharacterized SAM-binding protein YcdF (DUF218 family)
MFAMAVKPAPKSVPTAPTSPMSPAAPAQGRAGSAQGSTRRAGTRRPPSILQRVRDLFIVAIAFSIAAGALGIYTTFRIWQVGQADGRRHVDAIVVLGAAQYNGRPSGALAARLDHAIELYKEGLAPYLITTGGNLPGDRTTEAETGRRYAIANGVPDSAILMENTGHTTLESIQHVKSIFDARGLRTALFVSDRSHMLRVLRVAEDQGIEAWSSPTDTSPDDLDPNLHYKSMVHELGAIAQYVFINADPEDAAQEAPASSPPAPGASSTARP